MMAHLRSTASFVLLCCCLLDVQWQIPSVLANHTTEEPELRYTVIDEEETVQLSDLSTEEAAAVTTTTTTTTTIPTTPGVPAEVDVDKELDVEGNEEIIQTTVHLSGTLQPGQEIPVNIPTGLRCDKLADGDDAAGTPIQTMARSSNRAVARPSEPDVSYVEEEAELNLLILGGKTYGKTDIDVTLDCTSNGTDTTVVKTYEVRVLRPARRVRIQLILEYVNMGLCVLLVFLTGCDSTWRGIKLAWLWIVGALLVQLIVIPLLCLAFVELFQFVLYKKMAILAVCYSPTGLICLSLAVAISADLGLVSVLVILNYLLANVSMPIWNLQFRNMDPYTLVSSDIPFGAINVTFLIVTLVFLLGCGVNKFMSESAIGLRKASPYVAGLSLTFAFFSELVGGVDLFPTLAWKEMLLCIFWPAILMVGAALAFATCHAGGPRFRATVMFLTVRSFYVPLLMIQKSLPILEAHVSQASMFFFSLMTYIIALSVVIAHLCYTCISEDSDKVLNPPPRASRGSSSAKTDEERLFSDRAGYEAPPSYDDLSNHDGGRPVSRYDVTGETLTFQVRPSNTNV